MSGRIALTHEIKRAARKQAIAHKPVKHAKVIGLNPITVQMFGFSHPLTNDNDFELSQWMKLYDAICRVRVGDLALMHQADSWELFDVISDTDVVGIFNAWDQAKGPS